MHHDVVYIYIYDIYTMMWMYMHHDVVYIYIYIYMIYTR